MIYNLISLSLILVPFYEVIVRLFPYCTTLAVDTRVTKDLLSMVLSLGLGLLVIYNQPIRKVNNKYLLWFIFCILAFVNFLPKVPIIINEVDSTNFWVWKPMFAVLVFFIFFLAIQSLDVQRIELKKIFYVMATCGAVMTIYCVFQYFGFDQFWVVKSIKKIGWVDNPNIVGVLGQPTLVAPFMAMLIPFALLLRENILAVGMAIGVYLTHSQVAISAMVVSTLIYVLLKRDNKIWYTITLAIILVTSTFIIVKVKYHDNGRFSLWPRILNDVRIGQVKDVPTDYSFTGAGMGSFSFLFDSEDTEEEKQRRLNGQPPSGKFGQAHNDPLEILYCLGFGGLILFIMSISEMIKSSWKAYRKLVGEEREIVIALLSSFICIFFCSFFTFVFQLGVYWIYTVFVIGLLHNTNILKGENKKCVMSVV